MRHVVGDEVVSTAAITADRLVRQEMLDRRVKKPEAMRRIAQEAGVAPGSIERLLKHRLKHVARVADRINAVLVRRIERRIGELEGELATARLASSRPDDAAIIAAQAALEEAKRHIGKV